MASRSNIEAALITNSILGAGTRWEMQAQTIAAQLTLTTKHSPLLFLDAVATSQDVLLPPEASSKGLYFKIVNVSSGAADLIVKDDGDVVVIGVIPPGGEMEFVSDGIAWRSAGGGGLGVVSTGTGASYAVLAGNSGRLHTMGAIGADQTITLPVPVATVPLSFEFAYVGVAAEAQNFIILATTPNVIGGGLGHADVGGTTAAVYADAVDDLSITLVTPAAGTRVRLDSSGTLWVLSGAAWSATIPTIA